MGRKRHIAVDVEGSLIVVDVHAASVQDDFGGRQVRVRGHAKVLCHLMFGILALTVEQLVRPSLKPIWFHRLEALRLSGRETWGEVCPRQRSVGSSPLDCGRDEALPTP